MIRLHVPFFIWIWHFSCSIKKPPKRRSYSFLKLVQQGLERINHLPINHVSIETTSKDNPIGIKTPLPAFSMSRSITEPFSILNLNYDI